MKGGCSCPIGCRKKHQSETNAKGKKVFHGRKYFLVNNRCDNHCRDKLWRKGIQRGNRFIVRYPSRPGRREVVNFLAIYLAGAKDHFCGKIDKVQGEIAQTARAQQAKGQKGIGRDRCDTLRFSCDELSLQKRADCNAKDFQPPQHDTKLEIRNRHDCLL